jgi:hypothetical protein
MSFNFFSHFLLCILRFNFQKAERKDGAYVTRSILGDPGAFEELDRRGRVASPVKGQSKRKARPVVKKVEESADSNVSAVNEPAHIRVLKDVGLYVSTLQQQYKNSENVRARDEKRQTMLMTYLPINDKFNMNKEGQVLSRWQERQRDWVQIQEGISRKIAADPRTHSLMMSKTFDFRIKREEYDLIQAAIPPEVKFGTSVWERSLRNGNTRVVSVGHVFTGLECEIDGAEIAPVLIRKPRPPSSMSMATSKAFDVTDAMSRTKKRWRQRIEAIRPHDVLQEEVDGLQIQCESLFDWAIESAKQYFAELSNNNSSVVELEQFNSVKKSDGYFDDFHARSPVPTLELISSPEVVFNCTSNRTTRQLVTFRNTGSVAIDFFWKPEQHVDAVERAYRDGVYFGSKVSQILDEKLSVEGDIPGSNSVKFASSTAGSSGNKLAPSERIGKLPRISAYVHTKSICFFCSQPRGIILPGETLSILFGFNSTNVPAVVTQTWKMHTTPRTKFSISVDRVATSATNNLSSPSKPVDMMVLHLHGVVTALDMDENTDKRREMNSFINQQSLGSMCEDEYLWCLRRVRLPVRVHDLHERFIAAFVRKNRSLLEQMLASQNHVPMLDSLSIFVTPSRLSLLEVLCARVASYNVSVRARLTDCRMRRMQLLRGADDQSVFAQTDVDSELNAILNRHCEPAELASLRNEIFPEKSIVSTPVYANGFD